MTGSRTTTSPRQARPHRTAVRRSRDSGLAPGPDVGRLVWIIQPPSPCWHDRVLQGWAPLIDEGLRGDDNGGMEEKVRAYIDAFARRKRQLLDRSNRRLIRGRR